jgi:methyltransferase family protein
MAPKVTSPVRALAHGVRRAFALPRRTWSFLRRWTLLLPDLLGVLGQVDLFLHDSDHSYENMVFEFEQALPRLVPGGVLMSDDTHLHPAWDDFCAKHRLRPTCIGTLGVTRKRRTP